MSLVALLVALYLVIPVHVVAVAVLGAALGARVVEVGVAFGRAWVLREAAPRVCVGWIPGGYVRFVGAGAPDAEGYEQLPAWRRCVIPLVGPLAVLAVAAALLGPEAALESAGRAPAQLLAGLRPWAAAPTVIAAVGALLEGPALPLIGALCAKVAVFNLLPLPTLATGQALLVLLPLGEKMRMVLQIAGVVATLVLFVGWGVAGVVWLLG